MQGEQQQSGEDSVGRWCAVSGGFCGTVVLWCCGTVVLWYCAEPCKQEPADGLPEFPAKSSGTGREVSGDLGTRHSWELPVTPSEGRGSPVSMSPLSFQGSSSSLSLRTEAEGGGGGHRWRRTRNNRNDLCQQSERAKLLTCSWGLWESAHPALLGCTSSLAQHLCGAGTWAGLRAS